MIPTMPPRALLAGLITVASGCVLDWHDGWPQPDVDAADVPDAANPDLGADPDGPPAADGTADGSPLCVDDWCRKHYQPGGPQLRAVWGLSEAEVFAVGDEGTILHHDGDRWQSMASNTPANLHAIWGMDRSSLVAVGSSGTVLSFDGQDWSETIYEIPFDLYGLWGSSELPDVLFAVGVYGVHRYETATGWINEFYTPESLFGIWGASSGAIFAVGDNGTIARYDGQNWVREANSPTAACLAAVWSEAPESAVAVGDGIYRTEGGGWTLVPADVPQPLSGVWGVSDSNVYAVGGAGTVLHRDGDGNWNLLPALGDEDLSGVWIAPSGAVFVVGASASIWQRTP